MQRRSRKPQFPARPEESYGHVTSAIGLEETFGHQRARRQSLFKQTLMWITGLICAVLLLGTLAQAWSNSQLTRTVQSEQQRLQSLQQRNDQLKKDVNKYKDPAVIESEARQQLGYVRPGEKPVVVVQADTTTTTRTASTRTTKSDSGYWLEWLQALFGNG
ncbi:FtsB family cell division protein [Ktedonobacter racemifer]|uniref:Septum formation initiator n=1 Tax=Ktedonobacter racemifer DSM 44963 TaxID=485913 RepID=D6TQ05_KTERA|nr:septum formation initiator family protein [Ktedonobacter racemifer]EFH87590.1 Septum formation initiator [Ktedonobacter racemifer DSM 44963]